MATFAWEGKTKSGEIKTGIMDAKNADDVMQRLKAQAITPSKVKKKAGTFRLPKFGGGKADELRSILEKQKQNNPLHEIVEDTKKNFEQIKSETQAAVDLDPQKAAPKDKQ